MQVVDLEVPERDISLLQMELLAFLPLTLSYFMSSFPEALSHVCASLNNLTR